MWIADSLAAIEVQRDRLDLLAEARAERQRPGAAHVLDPDSHGHVPGLSGRDDWEHAPREDSAFLTGYGQRQRRLAEAFAGAAEVGREQGVVRSLLGDTSADHSVPERTLLRLIEVVGEPPGFFVPEPDFQITEAETVGGFLI